MKLVTRLWYLRRHCKKNQGGGRNCDAICDKQLFFFLAVFLKVCSILICILLVFIKAETSECDFLLQHNCHVTHSLSIYCMFICKPAQYKDRQKSVYTGMTTAIHVKVSPGVCANRALFVFCATRAQHLYASVYLEDVEVQECYKNDHWHCSYFCIGWAQVQISCILFVLLWQKGQVAGLAV